MLLQYIILHTHTQHFARPAHTPAGSFGQKVARIAGSVVSFLIVAVPSGGGVEGEGNQAVEGEEGLGEQQQDRGGGGGGGGGGVRCAKQVRILYLHEWRYRIDDSRLALSAFLPSPLLHEIS